MSTIAPNDLRAVIAEAIHAYELAQATRLQLENADQQQYAQQVQVGETQQQAAKQQLTAEYQRNQTQGKAEQERIGHLLVAIGDVDKSARDLLQKAGLAHITGAPVRVTGDVAPVRRADGEVTTAFATAQLAQADLKGTLLRLAQAYLEVMRWDEARRVLQPLLSDAKSPWQHEAHTLLCESYYRPGQQALTASQWENARTQLEAVLAQQANYRDAANLLRAAYLRPAQQALEASKWDVVRQHIQPWLSKRQNDAEAKTLLCESYYRQAKQEFEAKHWASVCDTIQALSNLDKNYRDTAEIQRRALKNMLQFIKIPVGTFIYGENKQQVHLDDFWISKTPITNAQYKVFIDATDYAKPQHWGNGKPPSGKEHHPVTYVSWQDAQAFCRWAGVQLPGERQWEKAARGTDGRTYPWGEAAPDSKRCNFANGVGDTSAVGQYPQGASPYGVLDMAGNVFEWCEDVHESGADRRGLRGGYYGGDANGVRCAARDYGNLGSRGSSVGFRVVAPSF